MSRKEQFNLRFDRITTSNGSVEHYCDTSSQNNQSLVFATVLSGYCKILTESLLEDIQEALKGEYYEDFYLPDSLTDNFSILISPPNVIIADDYIQPIQVWKELMEEWLDFLKS